MMDQRGNAMIGVVGAILGLFVILVMVFSFEHSRVSEKNECLQNERYHEAQRTAMATKTELEVAHERIRGLESEVTRAREANATGIMYQARAGEYREKLASVESENKQLMRSVSGYQATAMLFGIGMVLVAMCLGGFIMYQIFRARKVDDVIRMLSMNLESVSTSMRVVNTNGQKVIFIPVESGRRIQNSVKLLGYERR